MGSRRQALRTVAGKVAVITAVLAGSAASLIAILAPNHSLLAALLSGAVVARAVLGVLMRVQYSALNQAGSVPLFDDNESAARTALAENDGTRQRERVTPTSDIEAIPLCGAWTRRLRTTPARGSVCFHGCR
jgi:hypothetical protein